MFHIYLEKARNCEGPDRSPQYGATDLGLEYLPRATNSFLSPNMICLQSGAKLKFTT